VKSNSRPSVREKRALPDDLAALRRKIERFPSEVTAKLRAVAWRKSREVKAIAERLAPRDEGPRSPHNEGNPHLADSIVIIEDAEHKQFLVRPETPWQPNLGLWLERGTSKMTARPFMRPAGDQVEASYRSEMIDAATEAAEETFT
jgi:HK97 gp10 family phage protein